MIKLVNFDLERSDNCLTTNRADLKMAVPKKHIVVSDDDFGYEVGPTIGISLIQPSRNNLKYLKWSYDSIRKHQGIHTVEICVADDASTDGTWEWCKDRMIHDPHFKAIRNETGTRIGHTVLYDRLINEVASHDICMIYHADMYLCPGALDSIKSHIKPKTIVSLTRIEPPLHPPGPEKILRDFGTEPEEFDESKLLQFVNVLLATGDEEKIPTHGVFAPWAFYKKDFQEIGGHDLLFAPQSKEDSDIFNRFQLNGITFIQTWEGFVYHMTCRGSRFNPTLTTPGQNSTEWEAQNIRSSRNFIRKWGHFVQHDNMMRPIIPPKYDVAFSIVNCDKTHLEQLEPWCSHLFCDAVSQVLDTYIRDEQSNTKFNLSSRIHQGCIESWPGILVQLDGRTFNWSQDIHYIQQLSAIIENTVSLNPSNYTGVYKIGNLRVTINNTKTYEKELIHV